MRKLLKKLLKTAAVSSMLVTAVVLAQSTIVHAIPYQGDDTPPSPVPAFNVYTGVPSEGNESDFFKGKVAGSTAPSVNDVQSTCEDGQRFQLRVYVHNGASQYENDNGNGPSVAKDTKVKVALPGNEASSFTPEATISASNAASVSDTMTITCTDGRTVSLKYVTGTAEQYSPLSGVQAVSDSIVTTGAPVGTMSPNGDLWGCWDQRVWVRLVVEVEEVIPPVDENAKCEATNVQVYDNRRVQAMVQAVVENVEILGYRINFGDGTVVNEQKAEHTYEKNGTYKITGEVRVRYENGDEKWITSDDCMAELTFKPGQPTPTPTTIPDTGIGSLAGIFAAVSAAGTGAYQVVTRRKR